MNSEGTSVKQKALCTPWPSDVSSGSEGQLRRPCCLALATQALRVVSLLPKAWSRALYSRHLIIVLDCYMNE